MAPGTTHFRRVILLLTLWVGFALRVHRLGAQSLWYDETVSAVLASKSIPALVAHTAGDIHPPGYYLLLHLWMGCTGSSEYALAFFSLVFGMLLVALVYAVANRLLGSRTAVWACLLTAVSPFQVWYSQEVRMYTLGTTLGLLTLWFTWRLLCTWEDGGHSCDRGQFWWWGKWAAAYATTAALGLYVLYYFGFLLAFLATVPALWLAAARRWRRLLYWMGLQLAVLVLYLPWLPISWRQATSPPVPPWRGLVPWHQAAVEAWSAMSLGQSVRPAQVWPVLILTLILFLLGIVLAHGLRPEGSRSGVPQAWVLLPAITLGPLVSIGLLSLVLPLYHVRYVYTYAAPFYMLLGAGLAWLETRRQVVVWIAAACLVAGSAFSIFQMHTRPEYAADDLRGAIAFLSEQWRPGDAVLINAGYVYTAFVYYYPGPYVGPARLTSSWEPASTEPLVVQMGVIDGDPNLGWGRSESDFYPLSREGAEAGLTRLSHDFPRLWILRAYDTVSDRDGLVRTWLQEHMLMFEDRTFAGESYVHVSGYMSAQQPPPPVMDPVPIDGGMTILGWQAPSSAAAGEMVDVVLWLEVADGSAAAERPVAVSLKLWGLRAEKGENEPLLAAQQDAWPAGNRLLTSEWRTATAIRYPMRLDLPAEMDPGTYWLNLEVYDPETLVPWNRHDGTGHSVPLAALEVED